jgi:cbb3-type cytochrome oxidase subunit 3
MSLTDIMSNAGLSGYAEIALVIFFLVFLGIVVYVFSRRRTKWDHERHLPLEDEWLQNGPEDKSR